VTLAFIGDRLSIFQAMVDGKSRSSWQLNAAHTALNERHIREWTAMMAAGYIDYDSTRATFRLSPEQAMVVAAQHFMSVKVVSSESVAMRCTIGAGHRPSRIAQLRPRRLIFGSGARARAHGPLRR